ncbi:MAG: OsmC family protein [Rhodothermia bacterium]|nr:OsmC family protein [Rhodothermia bacterium]
MGFPMQYETTYEWSGQSDIGTIGASAKGESMRVAGPFKSFGFDPESLFVSSAEICLANTFFFFANKARLLYDGYRSSATGLLEQAPEGGFRFREIIIRPIVSVREGDRDKADKLLEKAHKYCLISRSMKCPVTIEAEWRVSEIDESRRKAG